MFKQDYGYTDRQALIHSVKTPKHQINEASEKRSAHLFEIKQMRAVEYVRNLNGV